MSLVRHSLIRVSMQGKSATFERRSLFGETHFSAKVTDLNMWVVNLRATMQSVRSLTARRRYWIPTWDTLMFLLQEMNFWEFYLVSFYAYKLIYQIIFGTHRSADLIPHAWTQKITNLEVQPITCFASYSSSGCSPMETLPGGSKCPPGWVRVLWNGWDQVPHFLRSVLQTKTRSLPPITH